MRTGKKVIMGFIAVTGRTVRTFFGIAVVNNMANRQKTVRPFEEEVGTT